MRQEIDSINRQLASAVSLVADTRWDLSDVEVTRYTARDPKRPPAIPVRALRRAR